MRAGRDSRRKLEPDSPVVGEPLGVEIEPRRHRTRGSSSEVLGCQGNTLMPSRSAGRRRDRSVIEAFSIGVGPAAWTDHLPVFPQEGLEDVRDELRVVEPRCMTTADEMELRVQDDLGCLLTH